MDRAAAARRFWAGAGDSPVNDGQRRVLNVLLDEPGLSITASRWARIARRNQETALRDIRELLERGMLELDPDSGNNDRYRIPLL